MGLLKADLLNLARFPLSRWLGLVLLVLVLLRGLVLPPDPNTPWTGLWSAGLVTVAMIILTSIITGQDFAEGIFRSLSSRGVPRWWLLASKFVALALLGCGLLVVIEGLAVLLGVRSGLSWGQLARAWLSLWPYISLCLLLAVLARNGGLPLVIGVIWLGVEYLMGVLLAGMSMLPQTPGWEFITHRGLAGHLYQWTLSFNSANWTYLAEWQKAPVPSDVILLAMPRPFGPSLLLLVLSTLLGLGLACLVVLRREPAEVVGSKRGFLGLGRTARRDKRSGVRLGRIGLPVFTGKGPLLIRLVRAHLFKMGRTSLVKIGAGVALIFPLALWGAAAVSKAAGLGEVLFTPGVTGEIPLGFVVSLLMVGPLATVISILSVSNELTLGTRRAELSRGVTSLQSIVAQSLALMLTLGLVFAFLMTITTLIGASISGVWSVGGAALILLAGTLASGAYVVAAQIGGALTRSPMGAMLFGLGFLLVDWLALLAPTLLWQGPGLLPRLARYTVVSNTFAVAGQSQLVGLDAGWTYLSPPLALSVLVAYIVIGTLLAALIAAWRDA